MIHSSISSYCGGLLVEPRRIAWHMCEIIMSQFPGQDDTPTNHIHIFTTFYVNQLISKLFQFL